MDPSGRSIMGNEIRNTFYALPTFASFCPIIPLQGDLQTVCLDKSLKITLISGISETEINISVLLTINKLVQ